MNPPLWLLFFLNRSKAIGIVAKTGAGSKIMLLWWQALKRRNDPQSFVGIIGNRRNSAHKSETISVEQPLNGARYAQDRVSCAFLYFKAAVYGAKGDEYE